MNHDFMQPTSIAQQNIRRDHIDEECEKFGIYYKKWAPLNPEQTTHCSVKDYEDNTKVPEEQELGKWCIMCPKNRFMRTHLLTQTLLVSSPEKVASDW